MKNSKLTQNEFFNKFRGASILEWDAYSYGYIQGRIDEGGEYLDALEQQLKELNERRGNSKSRNKKDS